MLACCAERFDALAMVKPQFEVGRERVGKGGVVRAPEDRRAALVAVAAERPRARRRGARLRLVGPAGPQGQPRDVRVAGRGRARRGGRRPRGRWPARSSRDRPRAHGHRALPRAARRRPPRRCARSSRPPSARASCCASTPRRRASTASTPRDGLVLDAPLSDDVELCVVARRRRHHPARAAPLRGHERAGLRRQLRRGRLPGHHRPRRGRRPDRRLRAGAGRRLRGADAARRSRWRRPRARRRRSTTSRSTAAPASASPSSPTRSTARRRARCAATGSCSSTPGGLDGLQPRQRRPGAGLGRGGLRRLVHRAALADRAGARGGAERPAVGPQPLAGRGRHLARRPPGRAARPRRRDHARRSCARRPTWRRSRARRSTGGCARSSGGWPHEHDRHRRRPRPDRAAPGRRCSARAATACAR